MKGAEFYHESPNSHFNSMDNTNSELAFTAADLEAQLILGLAKNLGLHSGGGLDIYGAAEHLASLLDEGVTSCDEEDDEDDVEQDPATTLSSQILAGYSGCMHEALRYLTEDEGLPSTHPLVQGLAHHLAARHQALQIELASHHSSCSNSENRSPSI